MQQPPGLHYTAIRSGVGYLLIACTIIVSAGASQALVGRLGVRNVLLAGMALLTLGLLFFTRVSPHGTYLGDLAPGFVLGGVGLGFAFVPVTIAAMTGTTSGEAGLASGLINASTQIGGALGLAILATVANSRTKAITLGGEHNPLIALTKGFDRAFLVGAGFAIAGALLAAILIDSKDSKAQATAEAGAPVASAA